MSRSLAPRLSSVRLARTLLVTAWVAAVVSSGCARSVEVVGDFGPQAYYRTGFPIRDVSEELERAAASAVEILVQRSYDTYVFAEANAPRMSQLQVPGSDIRPLAMDTISVAESTTSTGVVIASRPTRLTILTTHHAIHFPDTIVQYFESDAAETGLEPEARLIERISIKGRQENAVVTRRYVDPFEVLARDETEDLALIGVTFPEEVGPVSLPPSRLTPGDPRRLSLGSLVFVVGHPGGMRMVTHGIVGDRNRGPNASFLIDGLWNEGMSGAPILAVRGDGTGLEWVGIARAAAALTEYRLVAEDEAERVQDPSRPYEGPVYLQPVQEIRYGITFSVPSTLIRQFIESQRSLVEARGYPLPADP